MNLKGRSKEVNFCINNAEGKPAIASGQISLSPIKSSLL